MIDKIHFSRLEWACRRGMLELDLLLTLFLKECVENLNPLEQDIFKQLLETNDQQLFAWLMGNEKPTNKAFAMMVDKIRLHAQHRNRN